MSSLRFLLLTSPPFLISFLPRGPSHCTSGLFLSSGQGVCDLNLPGAQAPFLALCSQPEQQNEWTHCGICTKVSMAFISWVNGGGFWLNVYVPKHKSWMPYCVTFSHFRHSLSFIGVRMDILPVKIPTTWHIPAMLQHKGCLHFCCFSSSASLMPRQPPQATTVLQISITAISQAQP